MTHLVTDNCIKSRDFGDCIPECPDEAIVTDDDPGLDPTWLELNGQFTRVGPSIDRKGTPPAIAADWDRGPNKFAAWLSKNQRQSAYEPF